MAFVRNWVICRTLVLLLFNWFPYINLFFITTIFLMIFMYPDDSNTREDIKNTYCLINDASVYKYFFVKENLDRNNKAMIGILNERSINMANTHFFFYSFLIYRHYDINFTPDPGYSHTD